MGFFILLIGERLTHEQRIDLILATTSPTDLEFLSTRASQVATAVWHVEDADSPTSCDHFRITHDNEDDPVPVVGPLLEIPLDMEHCYRWNIKRDPKLLLKLFDHASRNERVAIIPQTKASLSVLCTLSCNFGMGRLNNPCGSKGGNFWVLTPPAGDDERLQRNPQPLRGHNQLPREVRQYASLPDLKRFRDLPPDRRTALRREDGNSTDAHVDNLSIQADGPGPSDAQAAAAAAVRARAYQASPTFFSFS
ncbi:hypothetical protein H0H92_007230 [Tricholoma furcatifolium]|nr:hypothetical protein H0H92_007230 [Tricholoma furcatifolium]